MTDINQAFCQLMLSTLTANFKKYKVGVRVRKDAWVIKTDRQSWEFHGPDDYYWYGHADNAADARYQGWSHWLQKHRPAIAKQMDDDAIAADQVRP